MKKILIVDDDVLFYEILVKILGKDYDIDYLKNPEEVIPYLNDNEIDLIITDYRMPQLTGKDLILRVKELYPDIQIILVTAYSKDYLQSQAISDNLPIVNYLRKPIKKSDIDKIFNPSVTIQEFCLNSENKVLNDIGNRDTIDLKHEWYCNNENSYSLDEWWKEKKDGTGGKKEAGKCERYCSISRNIGNCY